MIIMVQFQKHKKKNKIYLAILYHLLYEFFSKLTSFLLFYHYYLKCLLMSLLWYFSTFLFILHAPRIYYFIQSPFLIYASKFLVLFSHNIIFLLIFINTKGYNNYYSFLCIIFVVFLHFTFIFSNTLCINLLLSLWSLMF